MASGGPNENVGYDVFMVFTMENTLQIFRCVTLRRLVVADVSGQSIGPLKMELIVCPRNVGNYKSTLRDIPEERISHLHRGGSLKLREGSTNMKTETAVRAEGHMTSHPTQQCSAWYETLYRGGAAAVFL